MCQQQLLSNSFFICTALCNCVCATSLSEPSWMVLCYFVYSSHNLLPWSNSVHVTPSYIFFYVSLPGCLFFIWFPFLINLPRSLLPMLSVLSLPGYSSEYSVPYWFVKISSYIFIFVFVPLHILNVIFIFTSIIVGVSFIIHIYYHIWPSNSKYPKVTLITMSLERVDK